MPLGPGDVYVPHYYNNDWHPYYLTRDDLYQRGVNLNVPGAVTVVSIDDFTRGVRLETRAEGRSKHARVSESGAGSIAGDAFAKCSGELSVGSRKIDIPPGIARKLNDTTVVTSTNR